MNLSSPLTVLYNRDKGGNLVLKGFQRRGDFSPKIALLRFQKIHNSSVWLAREDLATHYTRSNTVGF